MVRAKRRWGRSVFAGSDSAEETGLGGEKAWGGRCSRWLNLWAWAVFLAFVGTVFLCANAVVELRHERELRQSGRQTRQAESRLRNREMHLRLAEQENHKLRAMLARKEAALVRAQVRPEAVRPVLLVGRR